MQTPSTKRIFQLPPVAVPATELPGGYLEMELPIGPDGKFVNVKLSWEQLAANIGLFAAYNSQPSLRKAVEFRTNADREAADPGNTTRSTAETLDPLTMCLGTEIYVANGPLDEREYLVQYDPAGTLLVWVDGDFGQSVRGKIQASIVPNGGGGAGGVTAEQLATVAITLPITASRTAAYTLQLSDAGCLVPVASSGAVTVTVPANSDVAFPVGTTLYVAQDGSGQVSIAAASGVVVRSADGYNVPGQWQEVSLHKRDLNTWVLKGGIS